MSADWYARRLGGGAPTQRQSTPPTAPSQQAPVSRTFQPYNAHPATQVAPQQQQEQHESLSAALADPNLRSSGGDAVKAKEIYSCPNCGSNDFFTRQGMGGAMGKPPAPCCMSCGYNGMYEQFGAKLNEEGR